MTEELSKLEAEEKALILSRFGSKEALALGTLIIEDAKQRFPGQALGVYIEKAGVPLWLHITEGGNPNFMEWIHGKRRVAERFQHSSAYVEQWAKEHSNPGFMEKHCLDPMVYRLCAGSFPINVQGAGVVGTVTVTGLARTDDHLLCVGGLRSLQANINLGRI